LKNSARSTLGDFAQHEEFTGNKVDAIEVVKKADLADEAMMAMGGFGRLQKISWIMNTLTQGAAAWVVFSLVFLEKEPVYQCRFPAGFDPEDSEASNYDLLPWDLKSPFM